MQIRYVTVVNHRVSRFPENVGFPIDILSWGRDVRQLCRLLA